MIHVCKTKMDYFKYKFKSPKIKWGMSSGIGTEEIRRKWDKTGMS